MPTFYLTTASLLAAISLFALVLTHLFSIAATLSSSSLILASFCLNTSLCAVVFISDSRWAALTCSVFSLICLSFALIWSVFSLICLSFVRICSVYSLICLSFALICSLARVSSCWPESCCCLSRLSSWVLASSCDADSCFSRLRDWFWSVRAVICDCYCSFKLSFCYKVSLCAVVCFSDSRWVALICSVFSVICCLALVSSCWQDWISSFSWEIYRSLACNLTEHACSL